MTNAIAIQNRTPDESWSVPPVDVFENKDGFLAVADLPGVDKAGLSIRYERGRLLLEGRREAAPGGDGPTRWSRALAVPNSVALDQIRAELENGVLRLTLPKSDAHRPREIPIIEGPAVGRG